MYPSNGAESRAHYVRRVLVSDIIAPLLLRYEDVRSSNDGRAIRSCSERDDMFE